LPIDFLAKIQDVDTSLITKGHLAQSAISMTDMIHKEAAKLVIKL